MSFDLNAALATWVVCQKRTGKHKQFVFVQPTDQNGQIGNGPIVIKGPFPQERANTVISRSQKLTSWNIPFIVHPLQALNGTGLKPGETGVYLVYPNLAQGYPLTCTPYTESMTNNFGTSYTYQVLNRSGLLKLGDVITEIDWLSTTYPPAGQVPPGLNQMTLAAWLLVSMTALYALGVGDVHFANVLADLGRKAIYIIDYDENRTQEESGELYYFKTAPAKDKLTKWLSLVRPWYPQIIQTLTPFGNDPVYGSRFKQAIGYLQAASTTTMSSGIGQLTSGFQALGLSQIGPQGNSPQIIQPNFQTLGQVPNIGQMKFQGLFGGSTTYSGYPLDEVKSSLQKAIRRNDPNQAIISAFELFRFSELANGTPAVSNLYNRLAIISVEDIGPANLGLVVLAIEINLKKNRDPDLLGALVQTMSVSLKTRLPSHIYRTYITPEGRRIAQTLGLQIDAQATQEDASAPSNIVWYSGDPLNIRPFAEIFKRRLAAKSFETFIWLYYFMEVSRGQKITARAIRPRRRQTDPMMIIWEIIKEFLPLPVWEALIDSYLELTENRPFLMCGIVAALYRIPYTPLDINPLYQAWRSQRTAIPFLTGQYNFKIDQVAIDKHTKRGKAQGKGREEFVTEGAVIEPEDPQFSIPALKQVYIQS